MELLKPILDRVIQRNPDDKEFIQAVTEVFTSLEPVAEKHPEYVENGIFERIVEPERQIIFRVPWVDDNGKVQVNRGYRVEFNSAISRFSISSYACNSSTVIALSCLLLLQRTYQRRHELLLP